MRVRRANLDDAVVLAGFGARTYTEIFGPDNRPEDMAVYLERSYGVTQQSAEIRDPEVVTLVAELDDGRLIGFAQVRRGATPTCVRGPVPVELWRFYVDRPWYGRGVAPRLLEAVEEAARGLDGHTLRLGVWERNPRAIAFCRKHGFVDVGTRPFVLGSDVQTDRVMIRALHGTSATTSSGNGTIQS